MIDKQQLIQFESRIMKCIVCGDPALADVCAACQAIISQTTDRVLRLNRECDRAFVRARKKRNEIISGR